MAGRTLQVFIAADTKKFRDGLDDAERRMGGFQGALGGLAGSMKNMLGPAMLGAGIAAGALATQFAVDGVKAAMEQEEANAKLARAFEAVGLSQDVEKAKAYVDELQRATGIGEDKLMPALTQLATKTGDLGEAQKLLELAMDASAAKGLDLESVTKAMTLAVGGNTTSLTKLLPELDKTAISTGGVEEATKQMSDLFGGAAATNAETLKGKMDRVFIAADEVKEAFGTGFLEGIQGAMDQLGGEDGLQKTFEDLEPVIQDVGREIGYLLTDLALIITTVGDAKRSFDDWAKSMPVVEAVVKAMGDTVKNFLLGPLVAAADALRFIQSATGGTPAASMPYVPGAVSTGGGNFATGQALGPAPRTPTVVAPLTALSAATRNQARRTSGKVVVLG